MLSFFSLTNSLTYRICFIIILLSMKVLVAKPSGKTNVYLATDLPDPVVLHWALSKQPGEWMVYLRIFLVKFNLRMY